MTASSPAFDPSGGTPSARPTSDVSRQFKEVLQRLNIPGWMINDRGVFSWVNDRFIELFGDRVGEHYTSIVAPESRETADVEFARKLSGTPVTDYEIEGVTRNGARVPMEVSSVRLDRSTFCGAVFGMGIVGKPLATYAGRARLTPRQLEILGMVARGASTNQIAAELVLSRTTVRNHISDILRGLGAHSRLEAVVKARKLDLVDD